MGELRDTIRDAIEDLIVKPEDPTDPEDPTNPIEPTEPEEPEKPEEKDEDGDSLPKSGENYSYLVFLGIGMVLAAFALLKRRKQTTSQ